MIGHRLDVYQRRELLNEITEHWAAMCRSLTDDEGAVFIWDMYLLDDHHQLTRHGQRIIDAVERLIDEATR